MNKVTLLEAVEAYIWYDHLYLLVLVTHSVEGRLSILFLMALKVR